MHFLPRIEVGWRYQAEERDLHKSTSSWLPAFFYVLSVRCRIGTGTGSITATTLLRLPLPDTWLTKTKTWWLSAIWQPILLRWHLSCQQWREWYQHHLPAQGLLIQQVQVPCCRHLASPKNRLHVYVKSFSNLVTLRGWVDSYGHFQPVNICRRTKVF